MFYTNDQMRKELEEAAKPLIAHIRKYHHPHTQAIVTYDSVEIIEGLAVVNYEYNEGETEITVKQYDNACKELNTIMEMLNVDPTSKETCGGSWNE